MQVKPQEWADFYAGLKRKVGLDLDLYKQEQLQRRVISMAEARAFKTMPEFHRLILSDESETQWFLDKLAINVSELFRNPEKWQEMRSKVLPELLKASPRLKCWSAGCSYGAEAHTLAAILDQGFPGQHKIYGSDIDAAALAQAQRGEFNANDMRGVPKEYRSYFEAKGASYFATPALKKYLTFRKGNLLADRFDTGYDLIMCRNVVIYFNDEAKNELYRRFYEALRPGGFLFVGSTERIFNATDLGFESPISFYYKKPMVGENKWRNAS